MKKINITTFLLKAYFLALNLCMVTLLLSQSPSNDNLGFSCPSLRFLDANNVPSDKVNISNLEFAFNKLGALLPNFYAFDEDKFHLQIYEPTSTEESLRGTLSAYASGDDPFSATPIDEIQNLELDLVGSNLYQSFPRILVADTDGFDDNMMETPENVYAGDDDLENDKTISAVVGGKLRFTYEDLEGSVYHKIIDVCGADTRVVRVNIINMRDANGTPYFSTGDLQSLIEQMQRNWKQACIKFVDLNNGELDVSDVVEVEQPDGVELGDLDEEEEGLDPSVERYNQFDDFEGWFESEEVRLLIDGVKDLSDSDKIDIILISQFRLLGQSTVRAEAYTDATTVDVPFTPDIEANPLHRRTIILSKVAPLFTAPHEIGHILTNLFHYGISYGWDASSDEIMRNLMRSRTSDMDGLYESKRLTNFQINSARDNTNLANEVE